MLRMIIVGSLAIGFALGEASVPKGATEIEPGVFKHTDAAGKTSLYRKTPFGVVKSTDDKSSQATTASKSEPAVSAKVEAASSVAKPADSAKASPFGRVKQDVKTQTVRVVEKGDALEFERPSPFGSYRWTKKKGELTDEERDLWTRSQATRASNTSAGAGSKE